jgi:acyl carrier protein
MSDSVSQKARTFIEPRLPRAVSDDEDFFALGTVNSLFAMELVLFIEDAFGTAIPDSELDLANFRTIGAITALVHRLSNAATTVQAS